MNLKYLFRQCSYYVSLKKSSLNNYALKHEIKNNTAVYFNVWFIVLVIPILKGYCRRHIRSIRKKYFKHEREKEKCEPISHSRNLPLK